MKIEIVYLTPENLIEAPEWGSYPFSCKYCLYWEYPKEHVDSEKERKQDILFKKSRWLQLVREAFGNCGKIAYVNGKSVGYAEYAPPRFLPRSAEYRSGMPSEDAVLISCLFIPFKEFRRLGLGSLILRSMINDLKKRGIKAIETFARRGSSENPSGPYEFYIRNGFEVYKDDTEFPLVRLEL